MSAKTTTRSDKLGINNLTKNFVHAIVGITKSWQQGTQIKTQPFNLWSQYLQVLLSLGLLSASVLYSIPVNAQIRQYSVTAWIEITGCDDGIWDNTLEVYADGRVNGRPVWSIPRNRAVDKECGGTIQILNNYITRDPNFRLDLNLMDRDSGSADDRVGRFSIFGRLDRAYGTHIRNWRSGDGEASKLSITIKPR